MTPAERARLIDRQEFEAECCAARQRAMRNAEACRQERDARIAAWLRSKTKEHKRVDQRACRSAKLYTHNGVAKSLSEWAEIAGVSYHVLAQRIRSGMEFERAITMKEGARAIKLHTINGVSKTLHQWADHAGITYNTLMARLNRGRTLAEALAIPAGRRGVSADFKGSKGTGAGSTAQETPEITFSEKAKNA